MAQPTDIESAILRTVAWFSLAGLPVTGLEIWRWMHAPRQRHGLVETLAALEKGSWLAERLVRKGGFFVAKGEDVTAAIGRRQERYADARHKFARLRWGARFLARVPGVRAVLAANTLAWWNTGKGSDIDLLIVCQPGRLWAVRLLGTLPFALLRLRPGAGREDPFCLSFFLAEDALDLSAVRDGADPYLSWWVPSLVPVHDPLGIGARLMEENGWIGARLPHASARAAHPSVAIRARLAPDMPRFLERPSERLQRRRLPAHLRSLAIGEGSGVVLSPSMLKFHDQDRRASLAAAWRKRYAALC